MVSSDEKSIVKSTEENNQEQFQMWDVVSLYPDTLTPPKPQQNTQQNTQPLTQHERSMYKKLLCTPMGSFLFTSLEVPP